MGTPKQPLPAAVSGQEIGQTEATPTEPPPLLVRRVVCVYRAGSLPGAWLQAWRRLDRTLERSGFKVKATLAPLDDLPEDTDILVVPLELREDARETAPGLWRIVTSPADASEQFAELVRRLEAGKQFTAQRVAPAEQTGPKIVTYRGSTRLD